MAEQKKKGKGAAGTAGIAALILLLAGGGYGVGRGQGLLPNEGDSMKPETEQVEVVEQEQQEPEEIADDGILTVRVNENQIYFEDEAVTAAELEEALLREYTDGSAVELVDDSAIKAGYDEAAAVLDKLGIEYSGR